jgi:choline-sulfatase
MTRREFTRLPVSGAAAATAFAAQQPASQGRKGLPNIIFVMADQMTPFMTGPYGQKIARTPNLDALARAGTVFENAYCNSPLCVPSRMSMFAGRLPSRIGAYDNASEFPCHSPTMMHYLRRAGYRTAVAGKTHFIGADQLHGFDDRLTPCIFPADFTMLPDWRKGPVYNRGTSIQSMLRALGPSKWNRQLAFDSMAFDRGLEYLDVHQLSKKDQPLFLNLSLTQPHDPFTSTKEFLDLYKNAHIPLPRDHGDIRRLSPTYEWFIIHHGLDKEKLSDERIREARRNYLAMISWVDDKLGQLMKELQRLGMDSNTILIFTSDHGEMMGEHGQWSKRLMLEWSSRIPLIMAGYGKIPAGKRVAAPVSLVDLFPTFMELAEVKTETPLDGRSLLPLLDGRDDGRERECIAEYLGEGTIEPVRMVRSGKMKCITVNGYPPQLFDLERDPEESTNLASAREYAAAETKIRKRADMDWDGSALKKDVIATQIERRLVQSAGAPKWNFDSSVAGPYRV